ncbi:armadillo-type protein [Choanephora cucurbitarum]|nr:armadillo-type protein [Choanephora cucurbitarum]
MDQNTVYQLFVATYHADPSIRQQAEVNIRNEYLGLSHGLKSFLTYLIYTQSIAAIYFKNRIFKNWDGSRNTVISEQDKSVIRASILHALITTPPAVKVQLAASLNQILACDFPENWPTFINELEQFMTSGDIRLVQVGLIALQEVVKVFQWKSIERREPLRQIIKLTFPAIHHVCNRLVEVDSTEAAELLKLALKTYHASIRVELPKCLQDPSTSLVPWGTLFLQLVNKKISYEMMPADLIERENFIWWKAKKWAYHCLNQLFSKYGNPALLPSNYTKYTSFAKMFVANFAPNILQAYLNQIDGWIKQEHWISNKCLALSAAFFNDSIKHKITWKIIKPYTDTLIAHFLFPQLQFSAEDEQLWTEDAVEYVHKKIDPPEGSHSNQEYAIALLVDLARDRKQHTFMNILGFKDGALCIIGALAPLILDSKSQVADMMEPFFVTHVFPEFKSQLPYLRARACDITRHFSDMEFTSEQNLGVLYQNVLDSFNDPEIPVRVQAALALLPMVRHQSVREAMAPNLPFVMQQLLNLTNEVDVDTLSSVIEGFVEVFGKQLTPLAVQLCGQLRDTLLRIMEDLMLQQQQQQQQDDELLVGEHSARLNEGSDKTMVAMGILKTIGTLILGLENSPDIVQQIEVELLPVIQLTLENHIVDLYDEIFEVVDSCTFSSKRVSTTMWNVFEIIYREFKETGVSFMSELTSALDNFIAYGQEAFVTNDHLKQMMFEIIDFVMKADNVTESDRVCACKLMESVLLHCKGMVDMCILPFLQLSFQYISTDQMKTTEFKVYCLEVVINCLYYNPLLTLHIMEENQWTQGFFTLWFSNLKKFSRVHDKKLVILTLCSLLALPNENIPLSLQSGWSQILISISDVFDSLPKAIENREEMESLYKQTNEEEREEEDQEDEDDDSENEEESEEEDEEEDEEDAEEEEIEDAEEYEDNDEDGNVHDEDTEYLEYLAQKAADNKNADVSSDQEDDDEEGLVEEILFESPLDKIDPYVAFEHVFRDLQQHRPDLYSHLTNELSPDHQNSIMEVLSIAEQNRNSLSVM